MKTNTVLVAIAGIIGSASAVAIPESGTGSLPEGSVNVYPNGLPEELIPRALGLEERDLNRRSNAGVFLCTDFNFQGYCVYINQPHYECINLSGDLNDKVSSLGPDSPNYCLFYSAFNCNDKEGHFGTFSPGYTDLRAIGWNDKISSYSCNPN